MKTALLACCLAWAAAGASAQRLVPSVQTFGPLNLVEPPSSKAGWDFEASRLDIALGGFPTEDRTFLELKKRNPQLRFIKYALVETVFVGKEKPLEQYCARIGEDPESLFLHYSDDTQAEARDKKLSIPGWGNGSAKAKKDARVRTYIWTDWRYTLNTASRCTQEYLKQRSVQEVTQDFGGYHLDGWFVDEIAAPDWESEVAAVPYTTAGGHIIEADNQTKAGFIGSGLYERRLRALFSSIAAAMKAATNGRSLLLFNIGNYVTPGCVRLGLAADGMYAEGVSWERAGQESQGEARFWEIARDLGKQHKIYVLVQKMYANPTSPHFSPGNYRDKFNRHQMYPLASYWMGRQPGFTYYALTPESSKPLQSYWIKAQEYDLGDPTGDFFTWQERTSGGRKFRIYRRDYAKAVVLFRTRYDWNDPYDDFSDATPIYPLDGAYRVLHADGTLGPVIDSIAMHLAEGVVLIPEPGAGRR